VTLAAATVDPIVPPVKLTYLAKRAAVTARVAMEKINKEVELELINITNTMDALERAENITAEAQAAEDRNVRRKTEHGVDNAVDLTNVQDASSSSGPRRRQDKPRPNRKDTGLVRLAVVKEKAVAQTSYKPMLSKSSISTAVQKMKDAVSGTVTPAPVHKDGISPYSVRNWDPQSEGALSNSSLPISIVETPVYASVSSSSSGTMVGDLFTPASAKGQLRSDTSEPAGLTPSFLEKPKTLHSSFSFKQSPVTVDTAQPVRSLTQTRTAEAKTAKAKAAASSTPVNKQLNKDILSLLQ